MTDVVRIREYSFLTPTKMGGRRNYEKVCDVAGLAPIPGGYGLLHCDDSNGEHLTYMTADPDYLKLLISRPIEDWDIPETTFQTKFPFKRQGWPDEWK
jgi:hypothetical protein